MSIFLIYSQRFVMQCYAISSIKNRETWVGFYMIWNECQTRLTTVRSATNPVDNHWQAGGSWADKERTVIAGRQCRLEAGAPASPSLRSPFHSPSRPSRHIFLASKPISYLNLHLRFLTFASSTVKYIPKSSRCFLRLSVYLYLFIPLHVTTLNPVFWLQLL